LIRSPDQTAAAPWCHPLLEGVVLVAHGVPRPASWSPGWQPL
jgi:hypothetical protein